MKKFILYLLILAAAAGYGYFAYIESNRVDVVKFSTVDIANTNFLLKVVEDKGFAEKNKLKLEYVYSNPAEAERKLADRADGVEVAVFNPLSMIQANKNKNIHLKAFAPFYDTYHTIIVKNDSKYKTLEDLKGARLAIRPKASAAFNALAAAMKASGYDLEKDFKLTFTDIPGSVKALTLGEVDATTLNIVLTAQLVAGGKYRILADMDEKWQAIAGAPMPFINVAAHADWLEQNPKKAKKLRNALLEAAVYIKKNPQVIEEYKNYIGYKTDVEAKIIKEKMPMLYPDKWDVAANENFVKKAAELGLIGAVSAEKLFVE